MIITGKDLNGILWVSKSEDSPAEAIDGGQIEILYNFDIFIKRRTEMIKYIKVRFTSVHVNRGRMLTFVLAGRCPSPAFLYDFTS